MHKRKLVSDGALLYAAHIFRYIFPIIIIPFLARQLGAEQYGIVLVGVSLATLVSMIVEFGFNVSGTRELAAKDPSQLENVVSSILTAKLLLMLPAIVFGLLAIFGSTVLRQEPLIGGLAIVYGLLQGTNLLWYFRARERMALAIKIEFIAQLLNILLLITFVRGPSAYILVLGFQILASLSTLIITGVILVREVKVRISSWNAARGALRGGGAIFVLTAAVAAYTAASSLVLGWLSTPEQVGYFGPAEKLITAGLQFLNPLSTLLLPHMTRELRNNPGHAYALLRGAIIILVTGATIATTIIALWGPSILQIALGNSYSESGRVFVVLGLILPLGTLSYCLSMLLLLPAHKDFAVTTIAIIGGTLNLVCAILLVPSDGAMGMATSRLVAEIAVVIMTIVVTVKSGLWHELWNNRGSAGMGDVLRKQLKRVKDKLLRLAPTSRAGL